MKIETKLNIGNKFWAISQRFNEEKDDFEWVVNSTPRIINRIDICCDEGETEITYRAEYLDGSRDICYYDESSCFATKEQAQAECDKRNKGEE